MCRSVGRLQLLCVGALRRFREKNATAVERCLLGCNTTRSSLVHRALGITATQRHRGGLGSNKSQEGWVWIIPSGQSPTCSSPQIANRVTVARISRSKGMGSSPSRCPHPYNTGGLGEHPEQPLLLFQGLPAGPCPWKLD